MVKKCIYCKSDINNESVIDFCERCGRGVWGEKMFRTIVKNMEDARERGDLCHQETPVLEVKNDGKKFKQF